MELIHEVVWESLREYTIDVPPDCDSARTKFSAFPAPCYSFMLIRLTSIFFLKHNPKGFLISQSSNIHHKLWKQFRRLFFSKYDSVTNSRIILIFINFKMPTIATLICLNILLSPIGRTFCVQSRASFFHSKANIEHVVPFLWMLGCKPARQL